MRGQHPPHVRSLFYLCAVFVVLPFLDIPVIGLSITAPLLLPVIYYVFFQTKSTWVRGHVRWVVIALGIWLAMLSSFAVNGPWLEMRAFKAIEVAYILRYAFWMAVFLATMYLVSDPMIHRRLPILLGTSIVVLACLRCFEGFVFGRIGAWTNTTFMSQNSYGIIFSSFTPFLFPFLTRRGWTSKTLAALGLLIILFACAINGSRGSWICIGMALAVFALLAFVSRPSTSLRLLIPLGLIALALFAILAGSARVREAVLSRFSTFENLERDKSYMVREVMNQRSLKLFKLYPWFGTGPGRYREIYVPLEMPAVMATRSDDDFMRKSSHNSYLSFLAEGGVVGALPLAALLVLLAIQGFYAAATLNRAGDDWALGAYASFLGMSIHFWALAGITGTHAWFVYGLLAATIHLSSQRRKLAGLRIVQTQHPYQRLPTDKRRPVEVYIPHPIQGGM